MNKVMGKIRHQDGIVIGNVVDKSRLNNPLSRFLVQNFDGTLMHLIRESNPRDIHEIGCGEGRLTRIISDQFDLSIRASDFSKEIIASLQQTDLENVEFVHRNIYDLVPEEDSADTIICCEVFEHLEHPAEALETIKALNHRKLILSVPNEPVWRILNYIRGAYRSSFGNTPGHIQHWSPREFRQFLRSSGFHIEAVRYPFPWIMVLGSFK
jgi:2-polyprenyl-3-methyl-5-hydroxy-6-metoxy-1,4-benzoquinol methylase